MQTALEKGRKAGLYAGMGIVVVDVIFGLVACLSYTHINSLISTHKFYVRIASIILLLFIAARIYFTKDKTFDKLEDKIHHHHEFMNTFVLSILNPSTIIGFLAIFNILNIHIGEHRYIDTFLVNSGILLGASTWWVSMSQILGKSKIRIDHKFHQTMKLITMSIVLLVLALTIIQLFRG